MQPPRGRSLLCLRSAIFPSQSYFQFVSIFYYLKAPGHCVQNKTKKLIEWPKYASIASYTVVKSSLLFWVFTRSFWSPQLAERLIWQGVCHTNQRVRNCFLKSGKLLWANGKKLKSVLKKSFQVWFFFKPSKNMKCHLLAPFAMSSEDADMVNGSLSQWLKNVKFLVLECFQFSARPKHTLLGAKCSFNCIINWS